MKEWMKKKRLEKQLKDMDRQWERSGADSWEIFAPSAYHTHTPEELKQIEEKRKATVEELLEQL